MTDANARDLEGAWRLESWTRIDDAGGPPEHPLGPEARGLILYLPDGHMSATLMRGDGAAGAFAYAGRWELRGAEVHHLIEVATDPALAGFRNVRRVELDGDRLTLSGDDFSAGTGRTQRIVWRRAAEG